MKLVALRRLRYPRGGPDGKEYAPGDTFEIDEKRDWKAVDALKKVGFAREVEAARNVTDVPVQQKVIEVEETPTEPEEVASAPSPEPERGVYQRRDLQAERPVKTGRRGRPKRS